MKIPKIKSNTVTQFAIVLLLLTFLFCINFIHINKYTKQVYWYVPKVIAQQIFDFSCPSGTTEIQSLRGTNIITNHLVSNMCIDTTGVAFYPTAATITISNGDVFAQANNYSSSGTQHIIIKAGTYSTSTTLQCANSLTVDMSGVRISYTGSGIAEQIANTTSCVLIGGTFTGPATSGLSIGLKLGISPGNGNVTTYNAIYNQRFTNFHNCVVVDGTSGGNGTYENDFYHIQSDTCNVGWSLIPTTTNFANNNHCFGCLAINNISDGWDINGANGWSCLGCRTELNGGWGWNFITGVTNSWSFYGTWGESNTSGDFSCNSQSNVTQMHIIGGTLNSTPNFSSDPSCLGSGNIIQVQARMEFVPNTTTGRFHFNNSTIGTGVIPFFENDDTSPPSGILGVLAYNISGANTGNLYAGTPERPLTPRAPILSGGTQSISGCSLSAPVGGISSGKFTSGTTGTCTVTITFGNTVAPNGSWCSGTDISTGAAMPQTTSGTGTCIFAGTTTSGNVVTYNSGIF